MTDKKPIDIAVIYKLHDDNGELLTQTLPDGRKVPDPVIFTQNYSDAEMPEIRFSFWDLDHETLEFRLGDASDDNAFEEFAKLQHSRMQDLVRTGKVKAMLDAYAAERRIAALERQLASLKQNGGGVLNLVTQD